MHEELRLSPGSSSKTYNDKERGKMNARNPYVGPKIDFKYGASTD